MYELTGSREAQTNLGLINSVIPSFSALDEVISPYHNFYMGPENISLDGRDLFFIDGAQK